MLVECTLYNKPTANKHCEADQTNTARQIHDIVQSSEYYKCTIDGNSAIEIQLIVDNIETTCA